MKIAYIVSSSYSGSTLLSFILNSHPNIGTISEFDNMDAIKKDPKYMCSCGQYVRECPFFLALKNRLNKKKIVFELDNMDMIVRLHQNERINRLMTERLPKIQSTIIEKTRDIIIDMLPKVRNAKERYYMRNQAFIEQILELNHASVFLDATKNPYRMLFLNKRFNIKGIYLIKNGIAGAFSYIKAARSRNESLSMYDAASRWFEEQITISRAFLRMNTEQRIMVSYSEICQKTEETIYRILRYLQLDPRMIEKHFSKVPHHIIGNAMRLANAEKIKEKQDWIDGLGNDEKDMYRKVYKKYAPKLFSINPQIKKHIWF